jgi:hypothetical protein
MTDLQDALSDEKSPYVSIYMARSQAEHLLRWIERQKLAGAKNRDVRRAIAVIEESLK